VLGCALALAVPLACAGIALAEPTGTIAELAIPSAAAQPNSIAAGPDGNMWFTEYKADRIARVTLAGAVTEFPLPSPESGPTGIAMGPDGNMWFTESGAEKREGKGERIGRITPAGAITEFPTLSKESAPEDITLGADGNLWFTEARKNRVGRITPSGEVAEFPVEHSTGGIAEGPDGNVWFTEPAGNGIGVITPTGTIHEFAIPPEGESSENSEPEDITAGLDGNLWFTEARHNRIGRITPAGAISQFPIPTEGSGPLGIAAGPDGNVWFTEFGGGTRRTVGRITPAGSISEFLTPTAESGPYDLAAGADGNLWLTEHAKSKLGVISTGAPAALSAAPAITGGGLVATPQACNGSWATWGPLQASATLFGFDGYRWFLDGAPIATGQSYTPLFAQVGHLLSCAETVSYPSPFFVTTQGTSAPVAVVEPPPVIGAVAQSAAVWREGPALAQIAKKRAPAPLVGTTFSFSLNEPASVTLSFTQRVPGRTVRHACMPQTRRNARRRKCLRTVTVGVMSFAGQLGTNTVAFQGRLSARAKLKPGRYALVISASNVAGSQSPPATLGFTIAPTPPRKHSHRGGRGHHG